MEEIAMLSLFTMENFAGGFGGLGEGFERGIQKK
jgi:hypothetical protein